MKIVQIKDRINKISGVIEVAGDKSISHRSLLLSAITVGSAEISGLLESEDVIATKNALTSLGVRIYEQDGVWYVSGVGLNAFKQPEKEIDCGNSGTSARLLMGLLASQKLTIKFTGDASLQKRPMARVLEPLSKFGVTYEARDNSYMPLTLVGTDEAIANNFVLEVPSAQVKSAIILAALNAYGETKIMEPELTRDHTEIMLKYLGFSLKEENQDGAKIITIAANQEERPARKLIVPGDPSSAAFITALSLMSDDGEVRIENVCINPLRIGFYEVVKLMGGDISFENERELCGEKVADIVVKPSKLKAVTVPAEFAARTIDEYPILAVLCAKAKGVSSLLGLKELKVKESDRLFAIYDNLRKLGVKVTMEEDSLEIEGVEDVKGEYDIETFMDHRIAMSFIILGQVISANLQVKGCEMIATSFPSFFKLLTEIGGRYTNG